MINTEQWETWMSRGWNLKLRPTDGCINRHSDESL